MADAHSDTTPAWIETTALTAPALLGAAAGLLLGDLMHPRARRGIGIGIGALGIAALLPFAIGGITGLVSGPRTRRGVRRKIQRIRDAGMGTRSFSDDVEAQLREQGLI
jgi:hypothetical protein